MTQNKNKQGASKPAAKNNNKAQVNQTPKKKVNRKPVAKRTPEVKPILIKKPLTRKQKFVRWFKQSLIGKLFN